MINFLLRNNKNCRFKLLYFTEEYFFPCHVILLPMVSFSVDNCQNHSSYNDEYNHTNCNISETHFC